MNADETANVVVEDEGLTGWRDGASATYKAVDFGGAITTFAARWAARQAGGRLEIWLDGTRRLGAVALKSTGGAVKEQTATLSAKGIAGQHAVVLKAVGCPRAGRLSTIELR